MSLHYRPKPSALLGPDGHHLPLPHVTQQRRAPSNSVERTGARPPPVLRQFGGFLGLLIVTVAIIVVLSFLDGMRVAQRGALHMDGVPMPRHAAAVRGGAIVGGGGGGVYAMLPAASMAALVGADPDGGTNASANGSSSNAKNTSTRVMPPSTVNHGASSQQQHPSRVFPRPLGHPIDSVVLVSFQVFPTAEPSGAVRPDALDPFERRLYDAVVAETTASAQTVALRDAAVVLMTRAMLSRPSGRVASSAARGGVEADAVGALHPYVSFFHRRRASYQTFLSQHDDDKGADRDKADNRSSGATICHRLEEDVKGSPIQFDVVYTHVEDDAPSQQRFREAFPSVFFRTQSRFRDWDELRYSMRSVLHRAMCGDEQSACHYAANTTADGGGVGDGGGGALEDAVSLVRRIYIVVADRDQVPAYLNASHPVVRIVLHAELFGAVGASHHLPSFNSHAIESTLHLIPGLSRFYVYFNNDMMWGRQVSLFDYFRPLSRARQRAREARMVRCRGDEGGVDRRTHGEGPDKTLLSSLRVTMMFEMIHYYENDESVSDFQLVPPTRSALVGRWARRQGGVAMNATVVAAQRNDTSSCSCCPRSPSVVGGASNSTSAQPSPHEGNCSRRPPAPPRPKQNDVVAFKDFRALFKLPYGRRAKLSSEAFRIFAANNRNYALEAMGVAAWPTHSFAHYPRMMDRRVMHAMLELDFRAAAVATRSHRARALTSLWTTMVCHAYHLMHRKVVDWEILMEAQTAGRHAAVGADNVALGYVQWPMVPVRPPRTNASASARPTRRDSGAVPTRVPPQSSQKGGLPPAGQGSAATTTAAVPPSDAPAIDDEGPIALASILPPYWTHAMHNQALHLGSLMFSNDLAAAARRLAPRLALPAPPRGAQVNGTTDRKAQRTQQPQTTEVPLWLPTTMPPPHSGRGDGNTPSTLGSAFQAGVCEALRSASVESANDGRLDFLLPRGLLLLQARHKAVARPPQPQPRPNVRSASAAGNDSTEVKRPFSNTALVEECSAANRQRHPSSQAARAAITDVEKLDHHVVKLDQRSGMYHFCMMHTVTAVHRYTSELRETSKLFVTLNDDFSRTLPKRAAAAVKELLEVASGNLDAAPWELESL